MAAGRGVMALVAAVGVIAAATTFAATPASAGFFEQLFGGLRQAFAPHHSEPARPSQPPSDPFSSLARALSSDEPHGGERVVSRESGPTRGFCVRTCDGHFFPVQAHAGMSVAEACRSFCPATETRVYSGSNIDYATTTDGSRYADLTNAYRYRKQLVSGCTCNGRSAFGLAPVDVAHDPTLRPGDVVATKGGLVAVETNHNRTAEFTPLAASRLPKGERAALSQLRVTQDYGVPRHEATGTMPGPKDERSAQLQHGR